MRLVRRAHPGHLGSGSALVLGNFDGMHIGHQKLLQQLKSIAIAESLHTVVVLFEPQPKEFFNAQSAPARLMRWRDKCTFLATMGIDFVWLLRFDAACAQMSAKDFLHHHCCERWQMRHMLVGRDVAFGRHRQGNLAWLQDAAVEADFRLSVVEDVAAADQSRVSSTAVRQALVQHQLPQVARMLGRPYSISGRVAHGQKLGRRLGFPTLNIRLHRLHVPCLGIYAVRVRGVQAQTLMGVANLGSRPVVNGKEVLLEVHCFDFSAEVYGARVTVELLHYIRAEQNFSSLEVMQQQMQRDAAAARTYFTKQE
jgi:riboflavin kinase/FMN adenylyltransferase